MLCPPPPYLAIVEVSSLSKPQLRCQWELALPIASPASSVMRTEATNHKPWLHVHVYTCIALVLALCAEQFKSFDKSVISCRSTHYYEPEYVWMNVLSVQMLHDKIRHE